MKRIFQISILIVTGMVLFACNKPEITYQLNFDTNGGTEIESMIIDQTTQLTLPEDPVKEGYMFWGWYLDDTTFNSAFTIDDLTNLELSNDLTIYAKWVNNNNVVEIIFNTAGGPSYDSFYVERGTTIELPDIVREGYTIDYWFTIIDQHLYTIEDGIFEVNYPISEITLQISWSMDIYLVNYELNGGINSPANISSYVISTDAIKLYDPEKEGYVFMGWYDNEDFSGNVMTEIPIGTNLDYTLYAKWEIGQFQITYNIYDSDISYVDFPLEIGESVQKISIGSNHFGLLTTDGQVYTWGDNYFGELGYYSVSRYAYPSNITHLFDLQIGEKISNIFMNYNSSFAVTTLNRVYAWGYNYYGQLGDGTTTDSFSPIDVTLQFNLLSDETIIQYTNSFDFSMAVTSSGRVLAWGKDYYIWLDEQFVAATTPTDITYMFDLNIDETIINAEISGLRAIAISSTGRVFEWGDNTLGTPGDGTLINRFVPLDITSTFDLTHDEVISKVAIGYFSSIALSSTGRLFAWGNNDYGQLGNGTEESSYIPIDITDEFLLEQNESITDISAGTGHFVVTTSLNRIFTWGYIYHGILYEIFNPFQLVPLDISGNFEFHEDETISNLSVGGLNSLVITSENRVLAWGYINQFLISGSVVSWITSEIRLDNFHLIQSFDINTYQETIDLYVPVREGYTFSGWYMDSHFIMEFELTSMPHYDLRLYGYWIPND